MVGVLIRMKLAIVRHSMTGERAFLMFLGALVGLLLAGGTVLLALTDFATADIRLDLLAGVFAVWTLGWILAPVLFGGGDQTLRPEQFRLLPISARTLATGLLGASFVGVAPVVLLVAFASLTVAGFGLGVPGFLVSLPGVPLAVAFVVLLSKVVTAVLGEVMRSRLGAALAALVSAAIMASFGSGWALIPAFERALAEGFPGPVSTILRALPSGWAWVAVDAADRGRWPLALGALLGLAVLVVVLLGVWSHLLYRRTTGQTASRAGASVGPAGSGASSGTGSGAGRLLLASPAGAVVSREMRTWWRDLVRLQYLFFALFYGLFFALMPLAAGVDVFLPWAGILVALWGAAMSANLYGIDGTALWLTLVTPGSERADVRGRQYAWLLVVGPPALLLTVLLTALSRHGSWVWPWVLALLPAVLGGAAGVIVLASLIRLVPMVDPHKRGSGSLENGTDFVQVLALLLMVLATAVPAGLVVWLGGASPARWLGVPAGLLTGTLFAWGLGELAVRRLGRKGAELLHLMRSGASSGSVQSSGQSWSTGLQNTNDYGFGTLPPPIRVVVGICLTVCWVLIFPQGVVPLVLKLVGSDVTSWFLPLHLPEAFQWPAIAAMIVLGLATLGTGGHLLLKHRVAPEVSAARTAPTNAAVPV